MQYGARRLNRWPIRKRTATMHGPPGNTQDSKEDDRSMSAKSANKHQTMADKADIHELYELSVQNVEHEIGFL